MNSLQKKVVVAALIVIAVMCVCPPIIHYGACGHYGLLVGRDPVDISRLLAQIMAIAAVAGAIVVASGKTAK